MVHTQQVEASKRAISEATASMVTKLRADIDHTKAQHAEQGKLAHATVVLVPMTA